MSLFQCENCGCVENTALSAQGFKTCAESFDWSAIPELKGKQICSACGPAKYKSGYPTGYGEWHRQFPQYFLPKGMFKTNARGNLEHVETGSEDYRPHIVETKLF